MAVCKLGALMAPRRLTEADRALVARWLTDGTDSRDRRVTAEAMATAITQGTSTAIGPTTLKDHRAGRCACHRGKATP
jgi:hypothetical protein